MIREERVVPVGSPECYHSRPDTDEMISLANCKPVALVPPPRCLGTPGSRYSHKVTGHDCSRQAKLKRRRNAGSGGIDHRIRRLFCDESTSCRRAERMYHRIEVGEPRLIRQPPRKLILENRQKWAKCSGTCARMELSKIQTTPGYSFILACLLCYYFLATDHVSR